MSNKVQTRPSKPGEVNDEASRIAASSADSTSFATLDSTSTSLLDKKKRMEEFFKVHSD
jgi:hypothetical protein